MNNCFNCEKEILNEFKFCPFCGVNLNTKRPCPKCSYKNEANSKFCQECGIELKGIKINKSSNLDESANEIKIDTPIPENGLTIEFNFSSSQTFEFAVEAAKKFDSFIVIGEGKKAIYRVTVNEDEIEDLDELIENLKGWRNRRIYHNGEKVPWDTVFSYAWCFSRKKVSYKPDLYCFGYENDYELNLWGCLQAHLNFNNNSDLFTYGNWLNSKADWKFDKKRIQHELEKKLFHYRFCPALDFSLISEVIDAFPDTVNPKKEKNWKFVENWGASDGLKVITNEYGYKEEKYMKGAIPENMKEFVTEIGKKLKFKLPKGI